MLARCAWPLRPACSHVTEHRLLLVVQREAPRVVRPAAEELVRCLVQLAAELKEPLFVTAAPIREY